jgi:cytochrome c
MNYMNLIKTSAVVLSFTCFVAACNNAGDTKTVGAKDAEATKPAATAPSDKGLELIGSSDCTTCHRLDKAASGSNIGPAYSEVADKYSPAADSTVDRLVKKIISGGSGIWGTTPMTPHAALSADTVKIMVQYIMTLKK